MATELLNQSKQYPKPTDTVVYILGDNHPQLATVLLPLLVMSSWMDGLTVKACFSNKGNSSASRLDTSALKAVCDRFDLQRLCRIERRCVHHVGDVRRARGWAGGVPVMCTVTECMNIMFTLIASSQSTHLSPSVVLMPRDTNTGHRGPQKRKGPNTTQVFRKKNGYYLRTPSYVQHHYLCTRR